jgi:hypothetical protein
MEKLENSTLNMFLVLNEPVEKVCFFEKSKFQQNLGSGWRLHKIISSFQIFLAGKQSKLTEKLRNSALNIRVGRNRNAQKFTKAVILKDVDTYKK